MNAESKGPAESIVADVDCSVSWCSCWRCSERASDLHRVISAAVVLVAYRHTIFRATYRRLVIRKISTALYVEPTASHPDMNNPSCRRSPRSRATCCYRCCGQTLRFLQKSRRQINKHHVSSSAAFCSLSYLEGSDAMIFGQVRWMEIRNNSGSLLALDKWTGSLMFHLLSLQGSWTEKTLEAP